MYKSPIEVIYAQTQTQMEGDIYSAVQSYGINVDKAELIRALRYDRDQYEKGYADAKAETEWISVKDRLPDKDGEHILVCYSDGWICDQYTPVDDGVTHWMHLPEPPKGE